MSFKKNVGRGKFSSTFVCPIDLAGVFFNEPAFYGMNFISEPADGKVSKTIVNLGIDQGKNLHS